MNKIWIFEELDKVSYNYHEGGGVVIVAKDLATAKSLVLNEKYIEIPDWNNAKIGDTTLDESVYIFPDAGCC